MRGFWQGYNQMLLSPIGEQANPVKARLNFKYLAPFSLFPHVQPDCHGLVHLHFASADAWSIEVELHVGMIGEK